MAETETRIQTRQVNRAHPARRAVLAVGLLGLLFGVVFALWYFNRDIDDEPVVDREVTEDSATNPPEYHPPSTDGYVGSAACAECHGEIVESYRSHPMSRSITLAKSDAHPETESPEDMRIDGKQRVLVVSYSEVGGIIHHEQMYDTEGELIYDQPIEMDYVVGSGQRAKAYLYHRGDALFMSPINWYSEAAKWDLAPNYKAEDPRRFDRRATDDCLACHAGRTAPIGRSLNRFERPAFHEMAIGCENCHGPGEKHIAFQNGDLADDRQIDPIVNPVKLDYVRRDSVCYQCHLTAQVRLKRFGRSHFDFRPGRDFAEIWTALDAARDEQGRSKAVSHVQQMHQSKCYTESNGRLGCISCHDPHRIPSESEHLDFYRNKCLSCHTEESCETPREHRIEQRDSCIACHMPSRGASNITHVSQTDHRVIRFPEGSINEKANGEADQLAFFNHSDRRLNEWEKNRALGLGAWLHLTKEGKLPPRELAQFLDDVLAKVPKDGEVLTVLGAIALDHNLIELARDYYLRARSIPDAEESALTGLLKVHYHSSEWEPALLCADELLRIDPGHARVHAMRAEILHHLNRVDEGIEAARTALEFNPSLIPVREWLVDVYRESGQFNEQSEQEEIIQRMQAARPPSR